MTELRVGWANMAGISFPAGKQSSALDSGSKRSETRPPMSCAPLSSPASKKATHYTTPRNSMSTGRAWRKVWNASTGWLKTGKPAFLQFSCMPKPRTYQRNRRCPQCGGQWLHRYGNSRGRQVWRCPECDRRHVADSKFTRPRPGLRQQAVKMRLGGIGVRPIASLLGVNQSTISRWTRHPATQIERETSS